MRAPSYSARMSAKVRSIAIALFAVFAVMSAAAVDIDGVVAPGEYKASAELKKDEFILHWAVQGDRIHMAIDAVAAGWVSVGFDPTRIMANSDMIFGLVAADGIVSALDTWSTGMFGPHPEDTAQGGKPDILASAGKRTAGRVVFEFTHLLDTGDQRDKVISLTGPTKVIWAVGRDLVFTSKHQRAGSATVEFGAGR